MTRLPSQGIDEPLSPEERDRAIDEIAGKIVDRGMETPAIMFLEMNKPVSFLAGQSIMVASPFIAPLFGAEGVRRYSQLFSSSDGLELLIRRIEELADEKSERRKK